LNLGVQLQAACYWPLVSRCWPLALGLTGCLLLAAGYRPEARSQEPVADSRKHGPSTGKNIDLLEYFETNGIVFASIYVDVLKKAYLALWQPGACRAGNLTVSRPKNRYFIRF
jgi:hypothetical protein